jgi:hypothetical protein
LFPEFLVFFLISVEVNWTNGYYGGRDIEGTNIAFTNGLFDPWYELVVFGGFFRFGVVVVGVVGVVVVVVVVVIVVAVAVATAVVVRNNQ